MICREEATRPSPFVQQNVNPSSSPEPSQVRNSNCHIIEDELRRATTTTQSPTAVPHTSTTTSSQAPPSEPPTRRSVNDYETEAELRRAMLYLNANTSPSPSSSFSAGNGQHQQQQQQDTVMKESHENNHDSHDNNPMDKNWDWEFYNYDESTTAPHSLREEIQRLQVLKSYQILDCDREPIFDHITGFTSRAFSVPICLISLVDLGRQWFMSNRGLGDVREIPRKLAFCPQAIRSTTNGVFMVKDASQDFRFKTSALVTGPPHIRFYAGAPLVSPEGYKLGTLCIIDTKPKPEGLTKDECHTLIDMAAMVVKNMVDRRTINDNTRGADRTAQMIACAAHDLLTPLTGLHLTLSLLSEDVEVQTKLERHAQDLVHTAAKSADAMLRICQNSASGFPMQTHKN